MYERPREKLRHRGVKFLTLAEIIQLIIGSGSGRLSGAQLARKVAKQVQKGGVEYEALLSVNGLGHAKVCQLLAALELGRRNGAITAKLAGSHPDRGVNVSIEGNNATRYLSQARGHGMRLLTCYWLDGSGAVMDYKLYQPQKAEHSSVLSRRILADALAASAHSLLLFLPSRSLGLRPTTGEMGFVKYLCDTAQYFQITILEVCAFNRSEHAYWKKEVI